MKSGRLKHFCEVCRKQCKDQNGYHCHLNSAHHQKRLRELATNPQQHIEKYSRDLQARFLQMLKVKYPGQTKNVQDLFEEYKQQSHHIKFNLTEWRNLQEFVQHLKKTGRNLKIEGKIPNCTITYLVNKTSDFITKKREEQIFQKRQRQKQMAQSLVQEKIQKSKEIEEEMFKIMRSKFLAEQANIEEFEGDHLQLKLDVDEDIGRRSNLFTAEEVQKNFEQDINFVPKKLKNVEKLFQDLEAKEKKIKDKQNQKEQQSEDDQQWVIEGITVKILPHQIPEAFHNKKSSIIKIVEPFLAQVQVGNATLDIDQTYLETVIPKIGHQIKIVRGESKGKVGVLLNIDIEKGLGNIQIQERTISLPFNSFSKLS